jgi:hypothetical protein
MADGWCMVDLCHGEERGGLVEYGVTTTYAVGTIL